MKTLLLSVISYCSLQSLVQSAAVDQGEHQDWFHLHQLRKLPRVKRVIGGEILTDISKWPWLANLDGKFCSGWWIFSSCSHTYCGASIINDRWVMTAAHCTTAHADGKIGNKWHIKIGEEKFEQGLGARFVAWFRRAFGDQGAYQKIHGEKVIVHENYKESDLWLNDIALIKLAKSIPQRDDISPVVLPPQSPDKSWPGDGDLCVMKGWGCTSQGGPASDVARVVTLKKVSDAICEWLWARYRPEFTNTWMCAGQVHSQSQQGICRGDSGGPLVCKMDNKWVQAGIASFTSAADPGSTPAGFTRVRYYTDWIQEKIRNN